jgi:hypothetical protein
MRNFEILKVWNFGILVGLVGREEVKQKELSLCFLPSNFRFSSGQSQL